jgi:hypothetical protein
MLLFSSYLHAGCQTSTGRLRGLPGGRLGNCGLGTGLRGLPMVLPALVKRGPVCAGAGNRPLGVYAENGLSAVGSFT